MHLYERMKLSCENILIYLVKFYSQIIWYYFIMNKKIYSVRLPDSILYFDKIFTIISETRRHALTDRSV